MCNFDREGRLVAEVSDRVLFFIIVYLRKMSKCEHTLITYNTKIPESKS